MKIKIVLGLSLFSLVLPAQKNKNFSKGAVPLNHKNDQVTCFTENKGQVHDQNYQLRPDVLYSAMAGNMALHIKRSGVSYQLFRVDKYKEMEDLKTKEKREEIDQRSIYRIDLRWLNCNTNFTKTEDEVLPGYSNYYLESCPEGVLNVKSYTGITLHNLYNGINLHYYQKNGELKYDYIVLPKADYKQIQVEVKGADIIMNTDGSLILTTPLGKVQEGAPIVYQNGKQLDAAWVLENNVLSFNIKNYNPAADLIIDPVTRLWGTYYGGAGSDAGQSCTTDASGNVYLIGSSDSVTGTVIATSGSYQTTQGGSGLVDTYLVKFNSAGVRQWGTYYGGSGSDVGLCCCTDASGNLYIAGYTDSGNAISSPGSHQPASSGGSYDAFLVKFNSSGQRLWGTYYGDTGTDYGLSCANDANGNVYLAGTTGSIYGTIIATTGSHQQTYGGGAYYDGFLVQFNSSGVRQWGTYYGGAGSEEGNSCITDASGNVYLSGSTTSSTGIAIATPGSYQSVYAGNLDAYLVQFNSSGVRQWGTYYGGTGVEDVYACGTDAGGNVSMGGYTGSVTGTVIASAGSHQPAFGGGTYDAFLVQFNTSGTRLWGTYYGGAGDDYGRHSTTDALGNVFLAGYTNSGAGTAIASPSGYQPTYGGGSTYGDAFLAKFNSLGQREWGTYYGGTGEEFGYSCTTDVLGYAYIVGRTSTTISTAIASVGSHQSAYGGGTFDAFLVKLTDCTLLNPVASVNTTICLGASINLSVSIGGTLTPMYHWSGPNGFTSSVQNPSITGSGTANIGVYTVAVVNGTCTELATIQIANIWPNPTITASSDRSLICVGESVTVLAGGALSYTFNPGGIGASIIISPSVSSTYMVSGTNANGCSDNTTFTQNVDACTEINKLQINNEVFKIYPNPTNGIINLELNSDQEIVIISALGQEVYFTKLNAGIHAINLAHLSKGIYALKATNGGVSKTFKLVKEQ